MIDRRSFLGTVLVAAMNGRVWRADATALQEFGDAPEFEPWRTWQADADRGTLALVRAAIISASAYNSQPWLFAVGPKRITIYADLSRHLGTFDHYGRELHISIGCALENLALAAGAHGYATSVRIAPGPLEPPESRPRPFETVVVDLASQRPAPSHLHDAIPHRHTNRQPFVRERALPAPFIDELAASTGRDGAVRLFLFTETAQIDALIEAILAANEPLFGDPTVRRDLRPWIRTTAEDVRAKRDGAFIDTSQPPGAAPSYESLLRSAPLFGLIAVRDRYDRAQTVRAGRVWQRAHLLATARGVAARPANGAVELIDHERHLGRPAGSASRLAAVTGDRAWQPTFMFYMGYATTPAIASPRRPIDWVCAPPNGHAMLPKR